MSHTRTEQIDEVAVIALERGRVNALNPSVVRELDGRLEEMEKDGAVRALVLTGTGKFFTFGFDIPEFLSYSKAEFTRFLVGFTDLYRRILLFPKPVVAGLNGHTIAGGCMLALACDRRVMALGKGKISLNEIGFGASVFAGCVEMLRACVGGRTAEAVLFSGDMYAAEEALRLGLVDRTAPPEELPAAAVEEARRLGGLDGRAFRSIKTLLRGPVGEEIRRREAASIREFVEIWYSEETWAKLRKIEIRR